MKRTGLSGRRNLVRSFLLIGLLAFSLSSFFLAVPVYGFQDQGTVYVVGVGTNSLFAIRGEKVVANISVGNEPFGVAVDPFGNLVFVTNYLGNSISVIDGFSNRVIKTFTGFNGPGGIIFAGLPFPLLYVAEYNSNDVAVVNPLTGNITSRINAGPAPEFLASNPFNNELYVTNANNNTVTVISSWNDKFVQTVTVGNGPRDLIFDPADQSIYVANEYARSVSVISVRNDVTTIELPKSTAPWSLSYNYFDNTIYAGDANFNGRVYEIAGNDSVAGRFSLGPFDIIAGSAFNPLNNITYFSDFQHGDLYFVSGHKLVFTLKLGFDEELFNIAVNPLS